MTNTLTIRPAWTPLTVFLMVIGFMFAWPLGLLILAYILWGERLHEFKRGAETHRFGCNFGYQRATRESGNVAFDEYRDRELNRLDEERRRLDEERREFEAYVGNLRRAKDQEEFDRFRSERKDSGAEKDDSTQL